MYLSITLQETVDIVLLFCEFCFLGDFRHQWGFILYEPKPIVTNVVCLFFVVVPLQGDDQYAGPNDQSLFNDADDGMNPQIVGRKFSLETNPSLFSGATNDLSSSSSSPSKAFHLDKSKQVVPYIRNDNLARLRQIVTREKETMKECCSTTVQRQPKKIAHNSNDELIGVNNICIKNNTKLVKNLFDPVKCSNPNMECKNENKEDKFISSVCQKPKEKTIKVAFYKQRPVLDQSICCAKGINFNKLQYDNVYYESTNPDKIQPPMKTIENFFENKQKDSQFQQNLAVLNIERLTSIQQYVIGNIVHGTSDFLVSAPTGTGKTVSYLIGLTRAVREFLAQHGSESNKSLENAIQCCPIALIILPTRELVLQTFQLLNQMVHGLNIRHFYFYGGRCFEFQGEVLKAGIDIIVSTPGRLVHLLTNGCVNLCNTRFIVIDEIDKVFDKCIDEHTGRRLKNSISEDFIMKTMRTCLKMFESGDIKRSWRYFLFSATVDSEVRSCVETFLKPDYIFFVMGNKTKLASTNIKQEIIQVQNNKKEEFVKMLRHLHISNKRIVVFVSTCNTSNMLTHYLNRNAIYAVAINRTRPQAQREQVMRDFREGTVGVIVATAVLSRGIHVNEMDCVMIYDLPHTIEDYIHYIGRTGRMGNIGMSVAFFNIKSAIDLKLTKELIKVLRESNQKVPEFLKNIQQAL